MSILGEAAQWIQDKAAVRRVTDGLVNIMTGFGTSRDKSRYSQYVDQPILSVWDLETLFKDSALAKKVVTKIPMDALRGGFKVRRRGASATGDAAEEAQAIADRCNELGVTETLYRAAWLGRLFGGAGIVLSLRKTGRPSAELDLEDVEELEIDYIRACDRQDFQPAYWRPDGSTERWRWTRVSKGGGPVGFPIVELHDSRVLWFGGADTTDRARQRNEYWDLSILQALFNTIVSYDNYWASLDSQVSDASQAVFHLQGFISALASNSGETGEMLRKRLALMDMGRSNNKALVLDAGDAEGNGKEDFQVIERASLANMDKLTGVFLNRLAADAGYPVSVLFEQAAAGTNATGEADLILHFGNVDVYRTNVLTQPATELVQLVARDLGFADPEEFEIVWPELYRPKPLDVASAQKMRADTLVGMVTAGIILEEEAALDCAEHMDLKIDRPSREKALKEGLKEVESREVTKPEAPALDPNKELAAKAKTTGGVSPKAKASGRAVKAKTNPGSAKNR